VKNLSLGCLILILASAPLLSQSSPVPFINQSLLPVSAVPGGPAFTLTITGTGFTSASEVFWNGSLRPTTVVSGTVVQAQIAAADIAKAGFGLVTVANLGAVQVQSNLAYFPIRTAVKGFGFLSRDFAKATSPGPVAVGDFNNDGILDFAVAGATTFQVFLGKGNGTFQTPIVVNTNKAILSMVTGDFNGDGNLDLAVTIDHSRHVGLKVFLGNGKGAFPSSKFYGLVNLAVSFAADFNGDGKLDLYGIGGDTNGPTFFTLLGHGDGTFGGINTTGPIPNGNRGSAIGDFNGDGNLDVAVNGTDEHGNSIVELFLGDGHGNFGGGGSYPVTLGGDALATADVNGDGKLDLLTDGVSVLLGNGDGTFKAGISIASGGSTAINIGDFNGDGKLDVAAGTSILFGNGDGTFQNPLASFAGLFPGGRPSISMGAFSGNGQLDLLGWDGFDPTLRISDQRPLYFTPTFFDFGSVNIGTTSPPQTATLTNFGSQKLVFSSINFTGTNSTDFAQTNNCGAALLPGKSCQIQATFTPSVAGSEGASLNVTYLGSGPLSLPVFGTGVDQIFTVTLTPSSMTFAAQLVGTTSASQTATLTNTGNQPVTISSIVATPPFSISQNNCGSQLPVNSSCQIQVVLTPTDKGVFNGTLSVTDNAVGSPQKVTLSGKGTEIVYSPTGVHFGNQKVGTMSVPIPVTVSNVGPSSVSITQVVIKGADSGDFAQTNNCPNSLPPQGQCTVTVTFTPKAKGLRSANIHVIDNDPGPQLAPLSGNGT